MTIRPLSLALFRLHLTISLPPKSNPRNLQQWPNVTLRKRQPYNTSFSRRRIVKTLGGHLRYHPIKKLLAAPKYGDCSSKLSGVVALRPREYASVSKTEKHVIRSYGGSRRGSCVR
ncbi:ribosomal protein L34e-domain-containing protein [Lactarius quietus]|nr:ribosomal protein L34e-domain-containing protein [Lactarius quietus]